MHVIFTPEGIPGWFGPEPVAGSEPFDTEELRGLLPEGAGPEVLQALVKDLLATHMRQKGRWLPRGATSSAEATSLGEDIPSEPAAEPEGEDAEGRADG